MVKQIVVVALLCFLVDWLLLIAVSGFSSTQPGFIRAMFAATLGGVHAGVCVASDYALFGSLVWRVVVLCVMGLITYGQLRRVAQFAFANLALGGFVTKLSQGSVWEVILALGLLIVLWLIGSWNKTDQSGLVPVRIPTESGDLSITALRDTGNSLIDPLTGRPVLVASASVGRKLLNIGLEDIKDPVGTVKNRSGYRLIPYSCVGGTGLLLAKRFENVSVGDATGSVLMAFAPNEIGKGKGFQALTGGVV